MEAVKHLYELRPRKDLNSVPCGYKGQGVSPRYRSVNKYHTTKSIHAGLSQANWLGIGIACTHFCSGGNTRPARLSGVRGGNFFDQEIILGGLERMTAQVVAKPWPG